MLKRLKDWYKAWCKWYWMELGWVKTESFLVYSVTLFGFIGQCRVWLIVTITSSCFSLGWPKPRRQTWRNGQRHGFEIFIPFSFLYSLRIYCKWRILDVVYLLGMGRLTRMFYRPFYQRLQRPIEFACTECYRQLDKKPILGFILKKKNRIDLLLGFSFEDLLYFFLHWYLTTSF